MAARGHVELAEHFAEVIIDGARADEQLRGDLRVGRAAGRQRRDLGFLRREVVAGLGATLAGGLAGGNQLEPGSFSEAGRAYVFEPRVRVPQVLPGLGATFAPA
jgi:hypothetical protein